MGKFKKKLAENVQKKKMDNSVKMNPFEMHINKQKYQVLGQRLKNDRGLPGVSRAKAIKKRKHTLLPEYNVQNKTNKFVDRRIGERNHSMTEEERQMARYTAERIKHHGKKSIYNLADDEVLTHRGQTLSEIEKFDDPRSEDEDDENEGRKTGKLGDKFVGDAHFGGGVLSRTGQEGVKSHKDLIEQLIAESKKRKAEKQKQKEQTLELTEKLDSEWKDLLPLVSKIKKGPNDVEPLQKADDYDKTVRQLIFEARGHPSDRLKSEDEIAQEEKKKLEQLEEERLNRMRGFVDILVQKQHKSADDLDDNFELDSEPEIALAYNEEGKPLNKIKFGDKQKEDEKNIEVNEGEEKEEEEDNEEEEESESDNLSDLKESEADSDSDLEEESENIKNERKRKVESIPATKSEQNKRIKFEAELKVESNEKETKTEKQDSNKNKINEKVLKISESKEKNYGIKTKNTIDNKNESIIIENKTETNKNEDKVKQPNLKEINEKQDLIEKAKLELPYTYTLPNRYESLQSLLNDKLPEYQNIIIERMLKCNHPSLAPENKENLARLFVYLLQHLNDSCPDEMNSIENLKQCFSILNNLTPHLYTLTQMNAANSCNSLVEVLQEKHDEYKRKPRKYPGIDVLIFLKLISCLFSTSDFRHQLVTPALLFMGQMLSNCKVKSRYDITYGLFLVTLYLEYTTLSKRYMPSALIYLSGILHMTIPKTSVKLIKINLPFKSNSTELVLLKNTQDFNIDSKMNTNDFVEDEINEGFKLRTIYTVLKLIEELFENLKHLPSHLEIFEPIYKLLLITPVNNYPDAIRTEFNNIQTQYNEMKESRKIEFIAFEKKRPKALRLYEPTIERVFDDRKHKSISREKADREKLLHKYKKEMKGALREIRRDKSFLGRMKIKQRIQSDMERKEKVRRIFADASIQQGELNSLDRKKKHKK